MTTVTLYPTVATHMAFKTGASNRTGTGPQENAFYATNELSNGDYSAVQTDDVNYCTSSATVSSYGLWCWVGHRFSFDCTGYTTGLSNINVKWAGYSVLIGDAPDVNAILYLSGSPIVWGTALTDPPTSHSVGTWDCDFNDVNHYLSGSIYNFAAVCQVTRSSAPSAANLYTTAAQITLTYAPVIEEAKAIGDGLTWVI